MNVLLMSICGESAMLVQKLREEGHECIMAIKEPSARSIGDGIFWKTEDPDSIAGQADAIVFDDNGMGAKADVYRKAGHLVWNGGAINDKLEYDRLYGMKVMRENGLTIPETTEVSSVNEVALAAEALKSKRCVVKIDGAGAAGTSFSFVADSAEQLEHQVEHWTLDGALKDGWSGIVQECVEGIEVSIEGWFDGEGFTEDFNITLEEKRPFAGNLGPNIGCAYNTIFPIKKSSGLVRKCLEPLSDFLKRSGFIGQIDVNNIVGQDGTPYALEFTPRCYSEDTEVLTSVGWRPIKEVNVGDYVASLTDDKELVFVPVERTVRKRVDGDMVRIKSENCFDILVTPDHDITLQGQDGVLYASRADSLSKHGVRSVRTARWVGLEATEHVIPEHVEAHVLGRHKKVHPIRHEERRVQMEDWCKFLGLFVAEGFVHTGGGAPYQTCIAQTKFVDECRSIMERLGFKVGYYDHNLTINSTQLARHLHSLMGDAKAPAKRIPRFVLGLAPNYIAAFLDGFCLGDGSIHKRTGQRTFCTTSKGLADDIGECLLRIGMWYRIVQRKVYPGQYGKRGCYVVSERKTKRDGVIFPKRHVKVEDYHGDVVCLTVPHHRLYVRRPGGPSIWCGNCGYDATPTLAFGWGIGWRIARALGLPYETPEFREGKFAGGVRVYIPPYPVEIDDAKVITKMCGHVVVERPESLKTAFYEYDTAISDGETVCAGSCGIIGVAQGMGDSPREAGLAAYRVAERVKVPGKSYRALDGPKRGDDVIHELLSLGLVKL